MINSKWVECAVNSIFFEYTGSWIFQDSKDDVEEPYVAFSPQRIYRKVVSIRLIWKILVYGILSMKVA